MVDSRATYIVVAAAPTPGPSPPAVSTTSRLGHTHTPSDPHITAGIAASRAEIPRFVTAAAAAGWTTTLPRQLSSRASVRERGEDGTERAQMRSAETGQLGERVVAGRRWRWGSHDSLGDGGDGLNRGGCGFGFGRKGGAGGVGVFVKSRGLVPLSRPVRSGSEGRGGAAGLQEEPVDWPICRAVACLHVPMCAHRCCPFYASGSRVG